MEKNEKSDTTNFGKNFFTRFIEDKCDRQLFLKLCQNNPNWMDPIRKIAKLKRPVKKNDYILNLGKLYEQKVYSFLNNSLNTRYSEDKSAKRITQSKLNFHDLNACYTEIHGEKTPYLILLENEFLTPISFKNSIFPSKNAPIPIPVKFSDQRPDIIIIKNISEAKTKDNIYELLPDGKTRKLSSIEIDKRLSLNVIDIKNTSDQDIGKKHFIEIMLYIRAFSHFIYEHKLDDKFFISVSENGIFPKYNKDILKKIKNLTNLEELILKIPWNESDRIFTNTVNKLHDLHKLSPCAVEDTAVNIHPNCGFCPFLEDCKNTLGMNDMDHSKNWSLKLIPFNSRSISQQLESYGFKTIGDVERGINKIKIGNTPAPLYPELPLLEMKVKSLINNDITTPKPGKVHSYCIPKFTPISLTFAIETDPSSDRVFAAGIYLKMMVAKKAKNYSIFKKWWKIWKNALDTSESPDLIKTKLDNNCFSIDDQIPLEIVVKFLEILKFLKHIKIFIPGMQVNGKEVIQTRILCYLAIINEGLDPDKEDELAIKLVDNLFPILELCNIVESYVLIRETKYFEKKDGSIKEYIYEYKADMGIFYWSRSQIEHLQDMLERNLEKIISRTAIRNKFSSLISWFTPSDSEVTHPYQHKKIFNLRAFIETVIGFPGIINYTWHEIVKHPSNGGLKSNKLFWIEHFNYMDPTPWYDYLKAKGDPNKQKNLKDEIIKQVIHKTRALNTLRENFQYRSRHAISTNAQPVKSTVIKQKTLDENFHSLAHVWYLFSELNGTMQDLEANNIRTIYPEYSIGKLNAAKISNLYQVDNPLVNYYIFQFQIKNLSSNMKINEGDYVLLIPDDLRDLRKWELDRKWRVKINKMIWNSKSKGYLIEVHSTENILMLYDTTVENKPEIPIWYLYPTSMDAWTNKLYGIGVGGLLERKRFGVSWLGARLAYLWNIRSRNDLFWPKNWEFFSNEIYMFLPKLLEVIKEIPGKELLTNINPTPDESQVEAIKKALDNVIYAIIGPPGTGKSQTIVALVDEFIFRSEKAKKPIRILVTSFSYTALRVIIDKMRKSKNIIGNKSKVAEMQLIFLRSESQQPIAESTEYTFVNDLVRLPNGSWRWNGELKKITKSKPLEDQLMSNFIIFGNAHQLFRLTERTSPGFVFDLILVDEASQLPTDYFLSSLQYIQNQTFHIQPKIPPRIAITPNSLVETRDHIAEMKLLNPIDINNITKVVIVGDYNQLPPVQPILPPKKLEKVLDSLFAYYVKHHDINRSQLKTNYRSHQDIVEFTKTLGIYEGLHPTASLAKKTLQGNVNRISQLWIREILEPNKVVCAIIHKRRFEIAVSSIEAKLVAEIVIGYYEMCNISSKKDERIFWNEKIGVVAPHNAQGRLIIHDIFAIMTKSSMILTKLSNSELMAHLKSTVYSVEKFQGSDRELIIASVGLSDIDQISAEEEFIYDMNRFNVLTSRAKKKIIYICSDSFLEFIPNSRNVMEHASHSYNYAYNFCNREKVIFIKNEKNNLDYIYFRWKDDSQKLDKSVDSFKIDSKIDGNYFEIFYSPNGEFDSLIQDIPNEIYKIKVDNHQGTDHEIWRFKFKDIPKICHHIVIPESIYQEYANKFEETIDEIKEKVNGIEEDVKSDKKVNKSIRKKIYIDFGDDDENSLF